MAAFERTNRATATAAADAEQVETLMIFSGIGLLVSLLLIIEGLDPSFLGLF